jgi:hypothetical protein
MSRLSPRTIPGELLEAADVAIGSRDENIAWATLFLIADEFRETGYLSLDDSFLAFLHGPLDAKVRRGLRKLDGSRVGVRFDGNEVRLVDGGPPR